VQAKVLSNAIWNAVNGGSSAVVAVLVPPFLTRLLSPEAYGAWALALQIGTYVALFGFGIQIAVGRYVAYWEVRENYVQRDGIVTTAFWFMVAASIIGWLAICGVGLSIERIVPGLSPALVEQTRIAIILVGLALAINLPSSVLAAVFTGRQRSDIPAKIQGVGRLVLAAGLVVAGLSHNLGVLGIVYAVISIGIVIALWHAWRTRTHAPTLSPRLIAPGHGRELAGFCLSLTLWSLAMLMVSGLDLIIVGRYDYAATAFYAVSVTLMTLVSGTLSSLANALIPAAASLPEDPDGSALRGLLERSSRLIVGAALLASLPLAFEGHALLGLWLNQDYARNASVILSYLIWATLIRNAVLPYVTISIGIGYQRKMTLTPLAEGAISIILSLILVKTHGAQGVAVAKIISGACGVIMIVAHHPLKAPLGGMSRRKLLIRSVLQPALSIVPVAIIWAVIRSVDLAPVLSLLVIAFSTLVSVWFLALSREDRVFGKALLSKIASRADPVATGGPGNHLV
jgi:O-antigen/teichoic acid export membrane protein